MDCFVTDGEKLWFYISNKLRVDWDRFESDISFTGRSQQLSTFFKELTTVNLVGRIIAIGSHYEDKYGLDSPLFRTSLRKYLTEYMEFKYSDVDELYRYCINAIRAANEEISSSLRKRITRWSKECFPRCYMCNAILHYNDENHVNAFTIEHIWPRSYGGNSVEDNLLPACKSCNSSKKKHFATWAMPSIQSLIYVPETTHARLQEIEGSYKFALHHRHVQNYARIQKLNLKRSFIEVGPWSNTRIIDNDDICDFFNLANVEER